MQERLEGESDPGPQSAAGRQPREAADSSEDSSLFTGGWVRPPPVTPVTPSNLKGKKEESPFIMAMLEEQRNKSLDETYPAYNRYIARKSAGSASGNRFRTMKADASEAQKGRVANGYLHEAVEDLCHGRANSYWPGSGHKVIGTDA